MSTFVPNGNESPLTSPVKTQGKPAPKQDTPQSKPTQVTINPFPAWDNPFRVNL